MRWMLILVLVTSVVSTLYAVQYLLGGPLQPRVTRQVNDLDIDSQGALVAAAIEDGTVRLWDLRNEWGLRTLAAHTGPVVGIGFLGSDTTLFSAGRDGKVHFWKVSDGRLVRSIDAGGPLRAATLSTNRRVLATLAEDGTVRIWDPGTGAALQSFGPGQGPRLALALSADGALLAAGSGPDVEVWSAGSGQQLQVLQGRWQDEQTKDRWLGHRGDVRALAFSPDGKTLLSGGTDALLVVWNLETGLAGTPVEGHWGAVNRLVFSPDGRSLLSGCTDSKVRAWTALGKNIATYEGHLGGVESLAFVPGAEEVLSGGDDGTVRVWNTVTSQLAHVAWTQPGLLPMWGPVLAYWMLGSGLLGLLCWWGLRRGAGWSHLLALGLYIIGPLIVLGLPILEVIVYPLSWGLKLLVAWPLLLLAAWYALLVVVLTREPVALNYEAPRNLPLSQSLMVRRRSLTVRLGVYTGAVWVLLLVALYSILRRFSLDVAFMGHFLEFIMTGAGLTFLVSAASIVLATFLALLGALGRLSRNPVANGISGFYISLIRGTPLLVQIFIWYLGLPRLDIVLPAVVAGILALGVNYGAYMTEIFRAGIQAIGKGQHEAAAALAMSPGQTFKRIVLPQAFRIVIPPIGNEFIAMMKDSSLVSVMGAWELTFRAEKIGRQYFRSLETFLIAAAFYWILTVVFQFLQGKLETYMARSERR
jgi:polar amino acid transport system permease protein